MVTSGQVLISYDIESLHTPVKDGMKAIGYMDRIRHRDQKKRFELPNTTLKQNH